ncbi:MAG: DUF1963 domain-containing protein [Sulfitobacter sp.]
MFGWLRKLRGGARKSAPPPLTIPQGTLAEEDVRLALERPCAPVVFQKPASIDPFETLFGAVRLARKEEVWPEYEGKPLWPLCQINLTQAPLVPDALRDLALITIFISERDARAPTKVFDTRDPAQSASWAIRTYSTLDGLTIPHAPEHRSTLSPRLGAWQGVEPDFANHDMAGDVIDTAQNDIYAYDWCRTLAQTKLGGWPGTIQSEPWWANSGTEDTWDFVLQIETEANAGWHGWGDGAAYIARSRERPHLWAIEVQFT